MPATVDRQDNGATARGGLDAPLAFVAVLWLGLLLGVSFIATPVKFQAPSLNLSTALDVGRVTFALFAKIEWVLFAMLVIAILLTARRHVQRWICSIALLLILLLQAFWLLPVLDSRVGEIIAGASVPATNHHIFYIGAELGKFVLLLIISLDALRMFSKSRGNT